MATKTLLVNVFPSHTNPARGCVVISGAVFIVRLNKFKVEGPQPFVAISEYAPWLVLATFNNCILFVFALASVISIEFNLHWYLELTSVPVK